MKITVSDAGFRRRQASMRAGVPGAARAAVIGAVDAVVDRLAADSPRDTNRYVRGWLTAAVQAGGKPRLVPAVVRGRFAATQIKLLEGQVGWARRQVEWRTRKINALRYGMGPAKRGTGKLIEKLERQVNTYRRVMQRAIDQVYQANAGGDEGFILIGRGVGRRLATVRTKVYGGSGSSSFSQGRARARIRNLEPHVKIVESRMGVLRQAVQFADPRAVASRIFFTRMRAAAGGTRAA